MSELRTKQSPLVAGMEDGMLLELDLNDLSTKGRAKVADVLNQSVRQSLVSGYVEVTLKVFSPQHGGQLHTGFQYGLKPSVVLADALSHASKPFGADVLPGEGGDSMNHKNS